MCFEGVLLGIVFWKCVEGVCSGSAFIECFQGVCLNRVFRESVQGVSVVRECGLGLWGKGGEVRVEGLRRVQSEWFWD